MAILASATDLRGRDLGGGDVELSWFFLGDIDALGVVFDVYSGDDPADVFRTLHVERVAALTTRIENLRTTGTRYFTVVSRRGDALGLPCRPLGLTIAPPPVAPPPVVAGGGATQAPSGLGFPFGITPAGGVHAQGGDPLLRGKILQLLLTSPGERVNRPDYGTRLLDMVFDPSSDILAATMEFVIARALQQHFSAEIQVDRVQLTSTDATLEVDVVYVKKADLQRERVRIGVPLLVGAQP